MPGVCPWGMLKLQFDRYIKVCNYYPYIFIALKNFVNISLVICLFITSAYNNCVYCLQ